MSNTITQIKKNFDRVKEICEYINSLLDAGFLVFIEVGFHPERLESHKQEIKNLLMGLPRQFREKEGGGWSFLQACMDKDGNQWGEHKDVEALVCLGIATGQAKFQLPRDMWKVLPGGMPYFVVLDK